MNGFIIFTMSYDTNVTRLTQKPQDSEQSDRRGLGNPFPMPLRGCHGVTGGLKYMKGADLLGQPLVRGRKQGDSPVCVGDSYRCCAEAWQGKGV